MKNEVKTLTPVVSQIRLSYFKWWKGRATIITVYLKEWGWGAAALRFPTFARGSFELKARCISVSWATLTKHFHRLLGQAELRSQATFPYTTLTILCIKVVLQTCLRHATFSFKIVTIHSNQCFIANVLTEC